MSAPHLSSDHHTTLARIRNKLKLKYGVICLWTCWFSSNLRPSCRLSAMLKWRGMFSSQQPVPYWERGIGMGDYGLACVYQSRSQSIRGQHACESHWASTAAGDLPLSRSLSATHPDTTTTVFPLLLSLFKILCLTSVFELVLQSALYWLTRTAWKAMHYFVLHYPVLVTIAYPFLLC